MIEQPNRRFTVLLAGSITPTPRLLAQVKGSRCVAADGGILHAPKLGLSPELWIGDSDSSRTEDRAVFANMVCENHPPAKAATDGALALDRAVSLGARQIIAVGAFGGRTDHTFALLAHACTLAQKGIEMILTDGREEATTLGPRPRRFDYEPGTGFSVIAFTRLAGLTITGARWSLDSVMVPFGDSLTISNEVAGELSASLREGHALLLARLQTAGI